MSGTAHPSATLLINCPDQRGLIAAVTAFLYQHNANILSLDQHVDADQNAFFMRVEFDLDGLTIPPETVAERFRQAVADRLQMRFTLRFSRDVPRMAIFVSRLSHCLYEILARYQSGEWRVEIPLILSNHRDLEGVAASFGIPFHHYAIDKDNKHVQEAAQIALLREHRVDLIVLARYMQILSAGFVEEFPYGIINIHHSFLPAFIGAKPYHAAYERGVKIIGATSHYVTADLDAGPILEQDVIRVNHRDSVDDLVRKGRDVEKLVLARALWNHLNNRVLVYNNKTIIFE